MGSTRIEGDGVTGVEHVGIEAQGDLQRAFEDETVLHAGVSNEPILQCGTASYFVANEHEIRPVAMRGR